MRRLRYQVAASLDGCIAGPNGEFDWIPHDPAVDFAGFLDSIDTVVMGSRSFAPLQELGWEFLGDREIVVFSKTLAAIPGITVSRDDAAAVVADRKQHPGKDIWLFGGGRLFRSLLEAGLVDTVEVAVVPVLLGRGIPLLPDSAVGARLRRTAVTEYPSGIVLLAYDVA